VGGGTIMTRKTLQIDQWMDMLGLLNLMEDDDSGFSLREAGRSLRPSTRLTLNRPTESARQALYRR